VFLGIRFKISVIIFFLIAAVTVASSLIVVNIMDRFILDALIQKGISMGKSAATVAGFNMLSDDRLALDNLSAKFKENQDEVLYVAAVDSSGIIRAHSDVAKVGTAFASPDVAPLKTFKDGSAVFRVEQDGDATYEFQVPMYFAGKKVGNINFALDSRTLLASQSAARNRIALVAAAVVALGVLGAYFLSTIFIKPVEKLSEGVAQLSTESYREAIPISSGDELGLLTARFNEMADLITSQKSQLKHNARKLEESYIATIKLLSTIIDARDAYTMGHSARVSNLSLMLGRSLGLDEEELNDLEVAAMFHDVGKIRTPDSILKKDTPLTEHEFVRMMEHTREGAKILNVVGSLHKYIPAVLYHHEWFNGEGYPEGLKGDEIPLHASIISVTDAFDAMTSSRPYRPALPKEKALEQLISFRGVQFAPQVVDPFIEILQDYELLERPVDALF
jgi:putative nucleotidyltransferase with HDIG domain